MMDQMPGLRRGKASKCRLGQQGFCLAKKASSATSHRLRGKGKGIVRSVNESQEKRGEKASDSHVEAAHHSEEEDEEAQAPCVVDEPASGMSEKELEKLTFLRFDEVDVNAPQADL